MFGRVGPALGRDRRTDQGLEPGPEHGHLRVASEQALVLEPAEPAADRVNPPGAVGRHGQLPDQPGDPIGVPGSLGVVDRGLGQPIGFTPSRRPPVQLGDQTRLTPLQLGDQQLMEQVMVAIPPTLAVKGDQQQVGRLQRLQDLGGSGGVQDRVAQRPRHPVQHRGAGQEREQLGWNLAQHLRPQIVGHEPVIPGEPDPGVAAGAARLVGQPGQIQPHRPPLGPPEQLVDLSVVEPDASTLQQGTGLLVVHPKVADPELQHPALGAQHRHRQRRPGPGGHQQLRPGGQLGGQLGHQVQALLVLQQLQVIKDHGHWLGDGRHRGGQPGHRPKDRGARSGQPANDPGVDRLDPIQRDRDIGQQHRRIVVARVYRHPTHPRTLALGPLGQQGRLAIAGRGHHTHHRHPIRGQQPLHQPDPGHDPRPGRGWVQLGLHQLHG